MALPPRFLINRRNAEWLWAPALFTAATLFLYREVWLGENGSLRWFGWDCLESYWPYLSFLRRALASGELPLWNPFERGGFPFHADPEPAIFYPVNWLFALLGLALGGAPPWMIQAKALLHHVLAGLLMHAYLRSRGLPRPAAATGGVIALANGAMIIHKASSIVWPVVWTPLVWIAIDRAVDRAGEAGWWRWGVFLGGAVALAGSAGSPPGFFYVLLAAVPYGVLRVAHALAKGRTQLRAAAIAQARTLAVAVAVAGALLLIIVLPASDLTALSARAEQSADWSVVGARPPAETLAGMISPAIGASSAYGGIAFLGLVLAALIARPRDRGASILFVAGGAFLLALSFGDHTPLLPFLSEHAPAFGWFRNPQRYSVPALLLLAAAAGHGVAVLMQASPRRLLALAPAAGLLLTLVLLLVLGYDASDPYGHTSAASLAFLLAALACAAALAYAPRLPRLVTPLAAGAFAVLAVADVDHYLHEHSLRRSERPVDDQEDRRWLADLPGDLTRDWRIYDEFLLEQRGGVRLGVRDFRGYPAGDPLQDARYGEVLRRARGNPELLQAFNVRWLFHSPRPRRGLRSAWIVDDPPAAHYRRIDAVRWEALHPAPAVAWYGRVQVAQDTRGALEALVAAESQGVHAAVVDKSSIAAVWGLIGDVPPSEAGPAPTVAGRIIDFDLRSVRAEVVAPADGLVVLNEAHAPGWRVTVDGRRARAVRANLLLRAVRVPAGRHVIVWTYHPPRWWWLGPLWLVGVASVLAAAFARPLSLVGRRLLRSSILRAWHSR